MLNITAWALNRDRAVQALAALGELLARAGHRFELVVIGGSGLLALGAIDRATRDVDVIALKRGSELVGPNPLPEALVAARNRVAADFGLPESWLNAAPASLLDFGLPEGFIERLQPLEYGPALTVWLASRLDQIHFKLYALADHRPGSKHDHDLRALRPTRDELLLAARWATTHDPSEGFRQELLAALAYLGIEDANLRG
jgi:Nucleotidyltransferase of unknown function (DUF6036)